MQVHAYTGIEFHFWCSCCGDRSGVYVLPVLGSIANPHSEAFNALHGPTACSEGCVWMMVRSSEACT